MSSTDTLDAVQPGMAEAKLAVIIVSWNTHDLLAQCLQSL